MRKASRQRDSRWALDVFDRAPYVTVSMTREDGSPYGVPLSLARAGEDCFYFHCAMDGEKIDCIRREPRVALSAVSKCSPRFEAEKENFTEYYRSAMAEGMAAIVEDPAEKTEALRLICQRYLPDAMDHFDSAIARSLAITAVVRITLTAPPTGKVKGFD